MHNVVRILVVDDHQLFREAVVSKLQEESHFEVIGQTDNGADALSMARRLHPDVILLDISLQGMDGIETSRLLQVNEIHSQVIILSMHADHAHVGRALAQGVAGYVLKDEAFSDLVDAIHTVRTNTRYLSPKLGPLSSAQPRVQGGKADDEVLTPRELEVLTLVASGLSNQDISGKLGRSIKTVESHRANLGRKLGLRNVAELTRYAIRHGYIDP